MISTRGILSWGILSWGDLCRGILSGDLAIAPNTRMGNSETMVNRSIEYFFNNFSKNDVLGILLQYNPKFLNFTIFLPIATFFSQAIGK